MASELVLHEDISITSTSLVRLAGRVCTAGISFLEANGKLRDDQVWLRAVKQPICPLRIPRSTGKFVLKNVLFEH